MLRFFVVNLLVGWAAASLHRLFVGTVNGGSLYVLELDDMERTLTLLRNNSAAGVSPSIAVDRSKVYLFGTRPAEGKISRYSVGRDYSMKPEGTITIPQSCNTGSFTNIRISSELLRPYSIYGTASTGTCSVIFTISVPGFQVLRSNEFKGDLRSFAYSPNGRQIHALDFQSNSLLNYNISETPSLRDPTDVSPIVNITTARQVVAHPTGHRVYIVTQDTNELIDIPLMLNDRVDGTVTANHTNIIQRDTPGTYRTTSLAISSSNTTLWTLSHTGAPDNTFIVTAFRLAPGTGVIQNIAARASFRNYLGDDASTATSALVPAPFPGDMVAVTTYPGAMVAVLGLVGNTIAAYGRVMLAQDEGCCGEGVWLD